MKLTARHGLYGFLAACAVVTLALLIWPAEASAPPASAHGAPYRGPDAQTRRGGPLPGFPIRLVPGDAAPSAAAPAEAAPALVGVAGRNAYLRSRASGEVERVAVGQSLDGWRLVSLNGRGAVVRGANGDQRVEMFAVEAPAAGSPDAAAAALSPGAAPTDQPISGG